MEHRSLVIVTICVLLCNMISGSPVSDTPIEAAQPVPAPYQPPDNYVPHAAYPYADTYPNSGFEGYLVPAGSVQYPAGEYSSPLVPTAQNAVQIMLKIFAKVGLFLVGGVALLFVGGLFTTAVCSLSPFCKISFGNFGTINKDTMRSFVTPDNISAAANFVQDAIGKYQRLQRAVGNP